MSDPLSKNVKEIHLRGFPICSGIAIAKSYLFSFVEENIPEITVPPEEIEKEVARYYHALENSHRDLIFLQKRVQREENKEADAILNCHLEIMRDPLMTEEIEEAIRAKGKNTEYVFKMVMKEYERKFNKISDHFFRDRLRDFQDISRRIIGHLRKREKSSLANVLTRSIVFAYELSPSATIEANTDFIEAFVTKSGAETSHAAIMARSRGIPFVSNVDFPDLSLSLSPLVVVDGRGGDVIINPSKTTLSHYRIERQKARIHAKGLQKNQFLEAETIDGYTVRLSVNIETLNELDHLRQYGCKGIGLFRSEYLFLAQGTFPSEEEQFLVYRTIIEKVEGHPSVIRTFDVGGDKFGNLYPSRYEKNPYLGCRAIRFMLKERYIFKTQIRAILRASAFGDVSILFPMISGLQEFREAKTLVEEVKMELLHEGIHFGRKIPLGCMIEVPSAALISDLLVKECDFLSIGTNDLVQYSLAVDRDNTAMSYLYTPTHPGVIRLIKMVVQEGMRANVSVSVCGEIAADPLYTTLLLGLGVKELSVACPLLPLIKNVVRHVHLVEARQLAETVLSLSTAEEVEQVLAAAYEKLSIQS